MGCYCEKETKVIPSEDKIREIIDSLKIRKLNITEIKHKIKYIVSESNGSDIVSLARELRKIFIETDESRNNYLDIHEEILSEFCYFLENKLTIIQTIFILLPISRKISGDNLDLKEVLKEMCGNRISYKEIYPILYKAIEFYTLIITQSIHKRIEDKKIERDAGDLIDNYFTEVKIEEKVKKILMKYEGGDKDEYNILTRDLAENLKKVKFYSYEEIRDLLIYE